MQTKRPPRLAGFDYLGFYRYFLTVCTEGRRSWFFNVDLGRSVVDQFLRFAGQWQFAVVSYCLMPDHLHALISGTRVDSDFRGFMRNWKQKSAFEWKKNHGTRLWQEGYYDRVLRDEEGDLWVISYIASNPVNAGLAESPDTYPLFGSSKYSMEEILGALKELEPWEP